MLRKSPPTYTDWPEWKIVRTVELAFGFHAVARPVTESTAAMRLRITAPTVVNAPPTYTVPASLAIAFTLPERLGSTARRRWRG